jgi:hypothetical protein
MPLRGILCEHFKNGSIWNIFAFHGDGRLGAGHDTLSVSFFR